jgi:hypothetical protein
MALSWMTCSPHLYSSACFQGWRVGSCEVCSIHPMRGISRTRWPPLPFLSKDGIWKGNLGGWGSLGWKSTVQWLLRRRDIVWFCCLLIFQIQLFLGPFDMGQSPYHKGKAYGKWQVELGLSRLYVPGSKGSWSWICEGIPNMKLDGQI